MAREELAAGFFMVVSVEAWRDVGGFAAGFGGSQAGVRKMKPPFCYYGGKIGMARMLADLLPPHRVYMEPFFGSGAVLFAKRPSRHEIVNDLDGSVATFFRVLRDRPGDLEAACRLTPYARAEYESADLNGDLDDLERARRFWVRVNQSFAKTGTVRTGWSVTVARRQSTAGSVLGSIRRFEACARRLSRVVIESCDAASLIDRLSTPDTVIYADPPYLASSRNLRQANKYRYDMGSEEEHQRLAAALLETPATVILSGYGSPLYDGLYSSWDRIEVPVLTHSSNAVKVERSERTEILWSNRPWTGVQPELFR